ncbi:uncharacterized protein LOC107731558 [Sinocyclocheilus rhinocerous]|uniref:uncharacterized protein LOC107731558 n=1 Tax=Sinocyclocheilus rhinocerous TaxID=307959 RepID=UPI0007BA2714|nr:PREDICTED: uncharacterized protein LOC107731558 [Sinocyclocheilus rhinocerous]
MDMKEMVIEVNGLPDNYSGNKMIDKLTMHFLRPSNNGGEVLIVIYPTSNKGQAYVVFEEEEVPGVLEHNHVLELDSQFYPLDVKKMHQPKLDTPAEAFLNVKMFSSQRKIRDILHSNGFQVSETSLGQLHLQGTFLNLKRIHPKLMHLLAQEIHPQRRTPSQYSNGYSSDSVLRAGSSDYESRSHSTSRHSHNNGHSVYAAGRNPSSGINSRSPESPNRQALMQAASPLDVSSSAESSFSSPTGSYEDSSTSIRQRNLSSPKRKTEDSFHVEPDVFKYVMHFKESFIEKIQSDYHTKINHEDDSGVVKVKVLGGACEEAAKKMSKFMHEMRSSLCTHEIDLKKLDSSQQRHIFQNAYSFQRIYNVLIRQESDIIKVVGSSKDSYEAKEKLLGQEVDNAPPGHFTKNNLRRSRSLPRPKTRAREENTDLGQSPDAVDTTTVSSSSASHSRTESQLQQVVQQERGRKPTKSSTPRIRAHSASRLQHKNQSRANQEASSSDQQDLTPSQEVQTSRQKLPKIIPPLFSASVDKFLKNTKSRLKK